MFYFDEEGKKRCSACDKICYSEREAGKILNSFRRHCSGDRLGRRKDIPRRRYFCSDCNHYHLTHTPYFAGDSRNGEWEKRFFRDYDACSLKRTVA